MKQTAVLALCSALIIGASPATAQLAGFGKGEGFTAGIGVIADWSPYEGADTPSTTPIPYLAYDWENAHLGVDGFSYDVVSTNALTVAAIVEPRWSFGDPEDSALFEDIQRDTAIEAGIDAEFDVGGVYFAGSVLGDVSGVHGGFEASAGAGFEAELGSFEIDTQAGYIYRDEELSLHLYGVKSSEARAGLAAFTPEADWYPYIRTQLTYPIGDRMAVFGFAEYEILNDSATNSPLINEDRDASFGIALLKRF